MAAQQRRDSVVPIRRVETRPSGVDPTSLEQMIAALRAIPYGGIDDNARHLTLSPQIRASVSPVINALRWSAVLFGMIFGLPEAMNGEFAPVVSVSICLFLTSWRTMLPLKLGSHHLRDMVPAFTDAAILGVAVGYFGGLVSPYAYCLAAATTIAAFGWGYRLWLGTMAVGSLALGLTWMASTYRPSIVETSTVASLAAVTAFLGVGAAFFRNRLIDAELRRARLAGRVETLSEANELLTMLNAVARTLPTSLNQREALEGARDQIMSTFSASVICLLEYDAGTQEWAPKLVEGCGMKPYGETADLPIPLQRALESNGPWLASDLAALSIEGISNRSSSGLYTKLTARGSVVGVLGVEHPTPNMYTERETRLLAGLADVVALTLDNARWFGRLRSLGAEEERKRISRDLHDRLGQWLTYISFELERIITEDGGKVPELTHLYGDVQTALDELRETLRQLRSGISENRPFEAVGRELAYRFGERSDVEVNFSVTAPGRRLSVPVENEMLRIMQEALNNVDRHAKATTVNITWSVNDQGGVLMVQDDGRGFDATQSVRDSAYGLVGMRERADVIGARLSIESAPGIGTTVSATVGPMTEEGRGHENSSRR